MCAHEKVAVCVRVFALLVVGFVMRKTLAFLRIHRDRDALTYPLPPDASCERAPAHPWPLDPTGRRAELAHLLYEALDRNALILHVSYEVCP